MRKKIILSECIIRLANLEDTNDLLAIARSIWDGNDYLPKVLPDWLNEPYFFVCEYHNKVIACIKLSLFPNHVLWFEGLRVLNRYQGNGIGSLLNREMFRFAAKLKADNPRLSFEFCTYYQNVESLHLTQKIGFEPVQYFYTLNRHGIKRQTKPTIVTNYDLSMFSAYPAYIPCGWQSVHNHPDSLSFIKDRITVFETNQARYYLGGLTEQNVTLLTPPPKDIKAELPYFQYFFAPYKHYGIILPTTYKRHIKRLIEAGFRFWDNEAKPVKNMLVLRKD